MEHSVAACCRLLLMLRHAAAAACNCLLLLAVVAAVVCASCCCCYLLLALQLLQAVPVQPVLVQLVVLHSGANNVDTAASAPAPAAACRLGRSQIVLHGRLEASSQGSSRDGQEFRVMLAGILGWF